MLKQIEEPINETRCESVYDFVSTFRLKKAFKEEYGVSIDDWQNDTDDQECIETLLEKKKGLFRCVYVEDNNCGHFIIEEYE